MRSQVVIISLMIVVLLTSGCTALHSVMGTNAGSMVQSMSRVATIGGRFRVELVECIGSISSQSVDVVLAITNMGPNANDIFIGGASTNTLAIDVYGNTYKPYSSSGTQYTLPTGVTVRVLVERITPVIPGVGAFQTIRVNVGGGRYNIAEFRNASIVWSN